MKEKFITSIMCLLLTTMSLSLFMPATIGSPDLPTLSFPGGDGSPGNPYQITNVTELQWMGNVSNLNKNFTLINDIDASVTSGWPGGFEPIGVNGNIFTGSLDGQGFTISGLFINRPGTSLVGLFGKIDGVPFISIENLNLESCNITGAGSVGGLVGSNSITSIMNCSVTGSITGTTNVGGFIGHNDGTITNCSSTGNASGSGDYVGGFAGWNLGTITDCHSDNDADGSGDYVGGFVGFDQGSIITDCSSTGNASGGYYVGGFAGLSRGQITDCFSTGNADGGLWFTGGFIGQNGDDTQAGDIDRCYSTGNATGDTYVGGFAGYQYPFSVNTITNCYSTGIAEGGDIIVGGFIGDNRGTITNSYSTGNASGSGFIGGFAGNNGAAATITTCFWDNETSGTVTGIGGGLLAGATGKNTTDMMTQATFTGAGWGFISTWFNIDGETRPFLQMEHNNKIRNSHQLQLMAMDLTADYELASDVQMDILDASQMWGTNATQGKGFLPVGNSTDMFTGSLNGGNLDINGLYINRSGETNVGLLGRIVTPAEITNITLTNVNVSGGENTATLVGYSAGGTLKNCHVACEIWGYGNFVGGLMGYNSLGTVDNSSFDGNVTANVNYVGGLIGISTGPVTYCSSSGIVDGASWTGGLIGDTLNSGFVENCTSSANVQAGSRAGGLIGLSGRPISNSMASGDVTANGDWVGGFVGFSSASIDNSNATGNVTTNGDLAGGFAGEVNGGTIERCFATGSTDGQGNIGGFAGRNDGIISNCSSSGNASGTADSVGGFAGLNAAGTIMRCFSSGNANGESYIGGFAGMTYFTITECYSTGNADGTDLVGGFIGYNNGGTVTNCYGTGNGSGDSEIGGFAGFNANTITNCYSTGNASGVSNIGGFAGWNTDTITDCFWDNETSGWSTSNGGTGKNTFEMMQQATFDPPWDFATIWGIYEFNTYPFLQATGPTYVPDADLEITIDGTPEPCNVGDALMYTVTVTNHGPDIAVNPVVNITLPVEVTWLNDSQGIGPPTGQYLEVTIGNLDSGETGGSFINVSVDTYAAIITASSEISSDTLDSNMSNNIDWANTTPNRAPNAVDDDYDVDEDSGPNTLDVLDDDTDADGDELTITAVTQGADGTVAIIDAGKNITYEPDADYVGSDTFNYTIDDGNGGTDIGTVTIDVNNINDAPVITTTDVTTATEDVLYSVDYNATDIDPSDTLTWSLETDAGWLSIHTTTGVLSGTPTNDDVGTFDVSVKVDDGKGGIDWSNFTLTVSNTNDAPVISTTTAPDGTEGQPYSSQVNASDVDGDALTWSLTSNATWLSINATGGLSGTPTSAGTFWANVVVDDGNGGTDSVNLTITITASTQTDTDSDGDGVPDDQDAFPDDPTEDTDTDGDGVGDNADAFPSDPAEDTDTDGDGIGNNADTDDDGDGIPDTEDDNPLTPDDTDADTGGSNTWLYLIIILVIVGIAGAALVLRPKGPKPVADEPAEEVADSDESVAQSDDSVPEGMPEETVPEPIESEELA